MLPFVNFRIVFDRKVDVSFVIGKVSCAPKKFLSIPRLELQSSVLGVRLSELVIQNHEVKISSTHFWTDSGTQAVYPPNLNRNS